MITFIRFGKHGRLGNQLFQLASLIGFKNKYQCELSLPPWKYSNYFNYDVPLYKPKPGLTKIQEPYYHFTPDFWDEQSDTFKNKQADVLGWLQSEKYWQHCTDEVKKVLSFESKFLQSIKEKHKQALSRPTIAISIRRGDYVDNPNYDLLPIEYYLKALCKFFNLSNYNLVLFSDDIAYCKIHFEGLENVYFADGSDIEQLCLMSMCENFIISNSTFSWWGAYLGEKKNSRVIRPAHLFAGDLLKNNDFKDHYPDRWTKFDHKAEPKIDLSDVTFTIPVSYDHNDRIQNLSLNVCMLQKLFDTKIIVGEQGGNRFESFAQWCNYVQFDHEQFHRTKMLNDMAGMATTPIIVNWDADVFVPPAQILKAVNLIRQGKAEMVYPYDGRFARVPRTNFSKLEKYLDVGILQDGYRGTGKDDKLSVGGAIFFNKESFITGGMENEKMISYAPEDVERFERFNRLGFKVVRVPGKLFHMDHFRGENSTTRHGLYKANDDELTRIRRLTDKQLKTEVSTWPWAHAYTTEYYETITEKAVRSRDEVFKILSANFKFFKDIREVIDIGSGLGEWGFNLKEQFGITYRALDYKVPLDRLLIPKENYVDFDLKLEAEFQTPKGWKFDMCICLEVMEHLSEVHAEKNIKRLTSLSDYVLFSAAIPHQGGRNHINEQWQTYWEKLFNKFGFYASEKPLVDLMKGNENIDPWYRGNMVLYSNKFEGKAFNYVDPQLWLNMAQAK